MSKKVFVTGASGFVGSAVIRRLLADGYSVVALVNRRRIEATAVQTVNGSLFDIDALDRGTSGCDAVIHLVGIIMEHPSQGVTFERIHVQGTRNVVEAARRTGVRRYIHMSALGVRPGAASTYHKTKFAAEEIVRHSGLDWTIFRPSLIHGPQGQFMRTAARWARRRSPPFLFMPYFGGGLFGQRGAGKLQPVYVEDVARAMVESLSNPRTIGQIYPLGGADQLTWPELHRTISRHVIGKPRLTLPMPVWKARLLAAIGLGRLLGFNRDQVIMSQEDNTCDLSKFIADFGWQPQGFDSSLNSYAKQL